MTETGGPTLQAGIRYQNQVAALYLGRMLDPRIRPRHEQPTEIRVEAPNCVDDFVVRFAGGTRRFFQVKRALAARGEAWTALWQSFQRQLNDGFTPEDRLELVLGEPSRLASQLSALVARRKDSDLEEWLARLNAEQRKTVSSIQIIFAGDVSEVWRVIGSLDVSVWPAGDLERDYVPQWMPSSSVQPARLFRTLSEFAWESGELRARLDGATLHERLRVEANIVIVDPPDWGSEKYREAIASLSTVEVPGTSFKQRTDAAYLWPRCIRYQQEQPPDFDDDFSGWRHHGGTTDIDLEDFPNSDLKALVVVAGPGFGKTTLVYAIARKTALAGLLPVVLSIPKLSESELPISTYLTERVNLEFDIRVDWHAAANTGSLVLLLDGLDEVSGDRRASVLNRLNIYRVSHPGVPWMLTVRDASALTPPGDASVVELSPLQNADLPRYVDFYRPGESNVSSDLLERIAARPDLAHMVRIPIFLALMLVLRLERQDLRRSDLLDSYLETLFRPAVFKTAQQDTMDTQTLRQITELAAFEALETDMIGVSVHQLERRIKAVDPTLRTDDVREALVRRGIFRREGLARLAFPFPIVQEYLASTELLRNYRDQLGQRLSMIARRPWAQAIQFSLERHPDPKPLIDDILTQPDDAFHSGLRLIGRCLSNGMSASPEQWKVIGERFASIWGTLPWRTNRLVDGIIVDALSKPLHPSVRARLGERRLIHHRSGNVLSVVRDSALSREILATLLAGDINHLLNLSDFQEEVDRLGTIAFRLYVERARRAPMEASDCDAIACLIGHLKKGTVAASEALIVANDTSLPLEVRLAARGHASCPLDIGAEQLIADALSMEGFHPGASAAQAMSTRHVDLASIVRLLQLPSVPEQHASKVFSYLFSLWDKTEKTENLRHLLSMDGIQKWLRDLALLLSVGRERGLEAFDILLAEMPTMRAEMVGATVVLFGHVLDRTRVLQAVSEISKREWTATQRCQIAGHLVTGLTYRIEMIGLGSGSIEALPTHPGRTATFGLLEKWISQSDYAPWPRLRLILNAVDIGVPRAIELLRETLTAALATPTSDELNEGSTAGQAIDTLHTHSIGLAREELEALVPMATYNLALSAIRVIAKGGSLDDAEALIRLYGRVNSSIRLELLGTLEPLAGRLGLRITKVDNKLLASPA